MKPQNLLAGASGCSVPCIINQLAGYTGLDNPAMKMTSTAARQPCLREKNVLVLIRV